MQLYRIQVARHHHHPVTGFDISNNALGSYRDPFISSLRGVAYQWSTRTSSSFYHIIQVRVILSISYNMRAFELWSMALQPTLSHASLIMYWSFIFFLRVYVVSVQMWINQAIVLNVKNFIFRPYVGININILTR